MLKKRINILLLLLSIGLFSLNLTPVFAQQMLLQVVGGGFRFDGPTTITFDSVSAQFSDQVGTKAVRTLVPAFIEVEDQNGGSTFDIQVSAAGPLTKTTDITQTIGLSNFKVRNIDGGSPDITTLNGRAADFSLNAPVNSFTALTGSVTLGSGTGIQPGQWQFYPEFELTVPTGTTIGTYETVLTFTII